MSKLTIAIPTYKRAAQLEGSAYFKEAVFVLPHAQRDAYKKVLPVKRMIVIPDKDDGSIPRKRNWILENMPRPLLMIDDDVRSLMMTEGIYDDDGKYTGESRQKVVLTSSQAMNVIENGFNLAHQWGCVFWGLNVNPDRRIYQQYMPISLTNIVLGPFHGHLKHDLKYDERVGTKDDYDFSLQVLAQERKILRLNKYSYDCGHGDNEGGIVSMRSEKRETEYCRAIMDKWGTSVIKYTIPPKKVGDLLNARINVPVRGV